MGIGLAVVGALTARHLPRYLRRGYDALAERGERVLHPTPEPDPEALRAVVDPYDLGDRAETPGATLAHDDLPLADYDHLTLGSLRARIRKLTPSELVQLLDYERTHADRLPVVTLFENRLRALADTKTG